MMQGGKYTNTIVVKRSRVVLIITSSVIAFPGQTVRHGQRETSKVKGVQFPPTRSSRSCSCWRQQQQPLLLLRGMQAESVCLEIILNLTCNVLIQHDRSILAIFVQETLPSRAAHADD